MTVAPLTKNDLDTLATVLDATALFPSEMLAEMATPFLDGTDTDALWLTYQKDGISTGFCYATPEPMADGAWNMLAIAVHPDCQNTGAGGALVFALETAVLERGGRILIADTSGTDAFAATRSFYAAKGYSEEARIRDFWEKGDDKVVFWKSLTNL